MVTTLFTGGDVLDRDGRRAADVVIDDNSGLVVEVGRSLSADRELSAEGCLITPGFVDLHVHFRQPGYEIAETIETGSRAAALGGFTTVVTMPNTTPCTDSPAVVKEVLDYSSTALCRVQPSAAITVGQKGVELTPMAELLDLGVRMFTDDGTGVQDDQLMRRALEYAGKLPTADKRPVVLAQHCESAALSQGGVMHEGAWSSRLGLLGQPSSAEELMVMRDITLCRLTGTRVHLQHLSTAGSVALLRSAKDVGVPVTAEVTPHHFTLTDDACSSYDPLFKVHPPLRSTSDIAAIREGLQDGTIDAIATDHAPHTTDTKQQPFDSAPPGVLGLETAFAVANTELDLPMEKLLSLLSWQPAEIAGVEDSGLIAPGSSADLAVIDPAFEWTVDQTKLASKASNTPFHGKQMTGKVRHTAFAGEVVVIDGKPSR